MSVRFSEHLTTVFPAASSSVTLSRDSLQEATDRCRAEQHSLARSPSTEFSRVRHTFETCRSYDITILFGNLGRNPLMLTYFLDLIFTHRESVGVHTKWPWKTPYTVPNDPTNESNATSYDYLFCVEPYFGFCVTPVPHVKHLILLTSHLSLKWPAHSHVVPLWIGEPLRHLPTPELRAPSTRPPLYHREKQTFQNDVVLDVSRSPCAHDAYLRLLTGRELARRTRYACKITQRNADMIQFHVEKIRIEADTRHWKKETPWIRDGYLKGWRGEGVQVVREEDVQE